MSRPPRVSACTLHRDMKIITCVSRGSLQHEDSMGNGSIIKPGDIHRMSAEPE